MSKSELVWIMVLSMCIGSNVAGIILKGANNMFLISLILCIVGLSFHIIEDRKDLH